VRAYTNWKTRLARIRERERERERLSQEFKVTLKEPDQKRRL
jgi:hypothetical protein